MRNLYLLFLAFFCSGLFSQNIDVSILEAIHVNRNSKLDPFFENVTQTYAVGSVGLPLTLYAVGMIKDDMQLKKNAIVIGESVAASVFITIALKEIIKRDRPFVTYPQFDKLTSAGSYAMPSGHSSITFATATSVSMAYPKWYVIAPSFLWATGVSYSRMHLGVHYPSDVLVGALLGSGSAYLTHKINRWLDKKNHLEK